MRATLRLGRVSGIDIGAHWSVLVIGGLLAFGLTGGVVDAALWAVVVPTVVVFLACLLAHELGHSLVAQRNGVRVKRITLWMLGGVAQLDGRLPSAGATFRIAAAGPAVSYLLAAVIGAIALGLGAVGAPSLVVQAAEWLALVNVVLGTFNLIPASPLDGGRILTGVIWWKTGDRTRAEVGATRAGQAFGGLLIALGVVGTALGISYFSLWYAFMGLFVYRTATAEQRQARLAGAFGDARVGDVMTRDPETVRGWMTVQACADEFVATPPRHHRLPVVGWDGAIVGVVSLDRLARVPAPQRNQLRVQDVAVPMAEIGAAAPGEPLVAAVGRMGQGPMRSLLVFDGRTLVGIVTPGDLGRTIPRPVGV
ncbi:MAG: site-2 protease family protein [Acidimicrobiia bacterium]